MSEVKSRPVTGRGRGSGRGGRGGFSSRGGRGAGRPAVASTDVDDLSKTEDEGELGELKSKYASKIGTIKEMFPDWTEQDIAYALEETEGDLEATVERISEGNISQWGEVKKKTKDRSVAKIKDPAPTSEVHAPSGRGGRGRGNAEASRGRGRGSDRGRGASRGGRGGHAATNGLSKPEPVQSSESTSSWADAADTSAPTDTTALDSSWEHVTAESAPQDVAPAASKPDGKRSWASMFATPKPARAPVPAPPKPQTPQKVESVEAVPEAVPKVPGLPPSINEIPEMPSTPPTSDLSAPDVSTLTPSADELTETNLEQVPDSSNPPATATAASTVASTLDPKNAGTPIQGATRPQLGGFATTAWKAASGGGRSASFNRKVQEQQEAVVMPGKHAVDRTTVQFGSMGLNESPDDVDVDSDREDAETREQPPQHSPIAPRASLPPAPAVAPPQQFPTPGQPSEQATPRQAPGLPPVNHSISHHDQPLSGEQSLANPSSYGYNQYNDRYGTQPSQRPFEPFGQQSVQADAHPASSQPQPQQTPLSSAGNEASSFYTSDNQRTYQNSIYGSYQNQPAQETNPQQRTGSAFGTSGQQNQSQNRFGQPSETNASGNSTPNPSVPGQPPNQSQQMPHQPGPQGGYGYGYPYYGGGYGSYMNHMNQNTHLYGRERLPFDDVRRYDDQYMSQNQQFGYGGGQGGYGGSLFGNAGSKQGMYGQGHGGYGMSPQTSYDQHSASPANTGAFGSHVSNRETGTSNLSNYGRSGSTQPSENPQFAASGSGHNVPDVFGRSQSGYNQSLTSGISQGGTEDSLRGYSETSKQAGPSPSLNQGRPSSAANPQAQAQGQGYGNYPNQQMHGQQASQYGGGPGHQSSSQNHQAQGYGGYGGGYGGNFYGSSRGGWGASYGH